MAWATCHSEYDPPLTCSLNYEQLGDICIRISTIPLSWFDAEEKCKKEGGHLISISSSDIQLALMDNIKQKISSDKETFIPPYADDIENFWTGGTVRLLNDWRWISTMENLSSYSFWKGGIVGSGCGSLCTNHQALLVSGIQIP